MRAASVLRRLRRAVLAAATLAAFACVICWLRQPDAETASGRFDRGENAIRFDGSGGSTHPDGDIALRQRFDTLKRNRVRLLYVPFDPEPPPGGAEQAGRLLKLAGEYGFEVIPQVGGIYEDSARPAEPEWRTRFVRSVARLLDDHPEFAGIQLRIESLPGGNADYLKLARQTAAARRAAPSRSGGLPAAILVPGAAGSLLEQGVSDRSRRTLRPHDGQDAPYGTLRPETLYPAYADMDTRTARRRQRNRLPASVRAAGPAAPPTTGTIPAAENLAAALRGVQAGLNGHDLGELSRLCR